MAFRRILVVEPDAPSRRALVAAIRAFASDAEVTLVDDAARALGRVAGLPSLDVAFISDGSALGALALASTMTRLLPSIALAIISADAGATLGMAKRMGLDAAVLRAPASEADVAEFLLSLKARRGD